MTMGNSFGRYRTAGLWIVLVALPLLSGCLSLRSVSATGAVGTWIGARVMAAKDLALYCEAENILAGVHNPPTCQLEPTLQAIEEVDSYAKALTEYATALRNLADYNDVRGADPARILVFNIQRVSAWGAMPVDAASLSTQQGAASLLATISEEWRRYKLEQIIKQSHPLVMALCEGVLSRTTLLSESARQMSQSSLSFRRRSLAEVERSQKIVDPVLRQQRQAQLVALLHFEHDLRTSYESLLSFKKAVLAFSRGHQILFDSVTRARSLRSHDKEIFEQLRKELPPLLK
ncbi:MAG: hypothetical protein JNM40_13380 [Myxococcales bacterium]|nr:hypothetical protein [Myxococcales bacterium]